MKTSIRFLGLLMLGAAASGAAVAADDMTVVSKETRNGKPAGIETHYMSSHHIRIADAQGGGTIVDVTTGTATMLDSRKKSYYVVTPDDLAALQSKMAEKMNDPRMKQGMAFIQGLGNSMASSTEVTKTGETRTVGGYNCAVWDIKMSANMTMTECVTTEVQYPAHAWDAYKAYGESMRRSMSAFAPASKSGGDLAEKMKAIKGFPVASSSTVAMAGMKITTSSEVTDISRATLPASTWDVPAGYQKVANPMLAAFAKKDGSE